MSRFKFILGLLLLALFLHFSAKSLRAVLTMIRPGATPSHHARPYTASGKVILPEEDNPSITERFSNQLKALGKKLKMPSPQPQAESAPSALLPKENTLEMPPLLQITMEDASQEVQNPYLGEEASAQLADFLLKRRQHNTILIEETGTLLGPQAQHEVMRICVEDERACAANIEESKTAEIFAKKQEATDRKTEQNLQAVFEKYKANFNYSTKTAPAGWKSFFQRVNSFNKADD